jgi:hypothetical protein
MHETESAFDINASMHCLQLEILTYRHVGLVGFGSPPSQNRKRAKRSLHILSPGRSIVLLCIAVRSGNVRSGITFLWHCIMDRDFGSRLAVGTGVITKACHYACPFKLSWNATC